MSFAKGLKDVTVRSLGRVLAPELPPEWAEAVKKTQQGGATPVRETERGIEFIGVCRAKEVSDDKVSTLLFQSGGGDNKAAEELDKKYVQGAACQGTDRQTLMPVLALTIGDPSGIGPEIAMQAFLRREKEGVPPFLLLADPDQLTRRASALGWDVAIEISSPKSARHDFARGVLPVLPLKNFQAEQAGIPTTANAAGTVEAIERAVDLVLAGELSAIVTCPISKKPLYDAGFKFPGHTEFLGYLAAKTSGKTLLPVMMLAGPKLRTVPVTIHIPLLEVAKRLSKRIIVETAKVTHFDLISRFGIRKPRLAIAGLNPHAGEDGAMGMEEDLIIRPAIKELRQLGIHASGPHPADTMFHKSARAKV